MAYEPDEQDELIGDAEAVGGWEFVEQLQYLATAETDALCRWDGSGKEPVMRRVLWLEAGRRLVGERRQRLGRHAVTEKVSGPALHPS